MVEAKSRVTEHARHISRSTTKNAVVAPAVYDYIEFCLESKLIIFLDDLHLRLDFSRYQLQIM